MRIILRRVGLRLEILAGILCVVFFACVDGAESTSPIAKAQLQPGLRAEFLNTDASKSPRKDVAVLPNVWLYVPTNQTPSPFLTLGGFSVVWQGFISVDLRSDYSFQADLNGDFKLEINGKPVLEMSGKGAATSPSPFVRLSKGTNVITARFRSPMSGDAYVRLAWIPKGGLVSPIPLTQLAHVTDPELEKANKVRQGRALFLDHRCFKCHTTPGIGADSGIPESKMDAPNFDVIGSRRNFRWMAQWILNPKGERPTASMPQIFRGPDAKENAENAAAFLASLKSDVIPPQSTEPQEGQKDEGKQLFENLHCVACHVAPDTNETDARRISLKHVRRKFAVGVLSEFLKKPDTHYAWTHMPNFKLSADEAGALAGFLVAHSDNSDAVIALQNSQSIERGKKIIQTSGCLNCHSAKLENQSSTIPLKELSPEKWDGGCVASAPPTGSTTPFFGFDEVERSALRAFASTDRSSLARHVAPEFAERQIKNLRCQECHGKFDGFPPIEILGGKLKSEWVEAFVAGRIAYKPRPWLPARMPAFGAPAQSVGQGMAMLHGFPPHSINEPPPNEDAVKIGQKLVSPEGGFSCVACHAVGKIGASSVFDSPGINLAYAGERLRKDFFNRWLYSPLSIDPTTKMPTYFDETGRSPLTDVYDGDGAKQIDAIWQYLRLGPNMPPPLGANPAP